MSHLSRHRNKLIAGAVIATAGGMASVSNAAPFASVTMIGKDISQGQVTFSTGPIQVVPGDTVVYAVLSFLNATGVTNTTGANAPMTVKLNNTDGINTLTFDAFQLASDQIQVDFRNAVPQITSVNPTTGSGVSTSTVQPAEGVSLVTGSTGWKNATGANGGFVGHSGLTTRPGGNDLIAIRPGQSPGTFRGLTSSQAISAMGTGLFVVGSLGTGALTPVRLRYTPTAFGGQGGGLQYNAGTTSPNLSDSEELGPDPFVTYGALNLTSIPEPGSLSVLGLAAAGLLARRKEKKA